MSKSNKGGFTGKLGKTSVLPERASPKDFLANAASRALGGDVGNDVVLSGLGQPPVISANAASTQKALEVYNREHEKTDSAMRHLCAIHYLLPIAIQTFAKLRHEHEDMAHEEKRPEGDESKDPYGLSPLQVQTLGTMILPTKNGPVLDLEQFYRAGWEIVETMRTETKELVKEYLKIKPDLKEDQKTAEEDRKAREEDLTSGEEDRKAREEARKAALDKITNKLVELDINHRTGDIPFGEGGKYTTEQTEARRNDCEYRALKLFIPLAEAIRDPDKAGGNLIEALRKKARGESLNASETKAITGIGANQPAINNPLGIETNTDATEEASSLFDKIINFSTNCGLTRLLAPCNWIRDGLIRGINEYADGLQPDDEYKGDWKYIGQKYADAQVHLKENLPRLELLIKDLVDNKYTPGQIVISQESIKSLASLDGYFDKEITSLKGYWDNKSDSSTIPGYAAFIKASENLGALANREPKYKVELELGTELLANCPKSPGDANEFKDLVKNYKEALGGLRKKYTDICRKAKDERPKDIHQDDANARLVREDIKKDIQDTYPGLKSPRLEGVVSNELDAYQEETDRLLAGKIVFSINDSDVAKVYCALSAIENRLKSAQYCEHKTKEIKEKILQLPEPRSDEIEVVMQLAEKYNAKMLDKIGDIYQQVDSKQKTIFEKIGDPDVYIDRSKETIELDKAYILFTRMQEPIKRLIAWAECHQPPAAAQPLMKVMEYAKREAAESAATTGAGSQAQK